MTQQEFIQSLEIYINGLVSLPSLFLSQVCKESGFGENIFYNNILGIKCHNSKAYAGCRIGKTGEVINGIFNPKLKLAFQVYNDIGDCVDDYISILTYINPFGFDRYKRVRQSRCFQEAAYYISKCGYATGLTYSQSLINDYIIPFKLYKYDDWKPRDSIITANFKWLEAFSSVIAGSLYSHAIEPPEKLYNNIRDVAQELQKLRDFYNAPIIVNSWYRTADYNASLKDSSKNSMHLQGLAVDARPPAFITVAQFYKKAREITNFKGFGIASSFLHMDLRSEPATWFYK